MSSSKNGVRTLVLVGSDYLHIQTIQSLAQRQVENLQVVVIAQHALVPYVKWLADYLRGQKSFAEVHLDLQAVCVNAGFGFYLDEPTRIDTKARRLEFQNRPPMSYDYLSLAVPGEVKPDFDYDPQTLIAVEASHAFVDRWRAWREQISRFEKTKPPRIAVVGSTDLAAEICFALHKVVRESFPDASLDLLCQEAELYFSNQRKISRIFKRELDAIGVQFHVGVKVSDYAAGVLTTRDHKTRNFDFVFWCESPRLPRYVLDAGLELSATGQVRVDRFSLAAKHVMLGGAFASGHSRRAVDSSYGDIYAENVARMGSGKKSLLAIEARRQKSYTVRLSGKRALWACGKLILTGRLVGILRRWQDRATVRKLTVASRGEDLNSCRLVSEASYTRQDFERVCLPYVKRLNKFNFSVGSGLIAFKAPHALLHTRSESPVYGLDFFEWTRLLMIESCREATAHGVRPEAFRIGLVLTPQVASLSLNYAEQVVAAASALCPELEFRSLDLQVDTSSQVKLVVDCFASVKKDRGEVTGELRSVNSAVIVTHALGGGGVYDALRCQSVRGIEFERFLRSSVVYNKRAVKFFARENFMTCINLHGLVIADQLTSMRERCDVEVFLGEAKSIYTPRFKRKLPVRDGWPPYRLQTQGEKPWDVYCELFARQVGAGYLIQTPLSEVRAVLESLRDLGYLDAAKLAEIRKPQKRSGRIILSV